MFCFFFFFQAEDGIRDYKVTGVQTCALPICEDQRVGAVAAVPDLGCAVALARAVLDAGEHVLLAGPAAWRFAAEAGIAPAAPGPLVTERALSRRKGTVRAVARDRARRLAPAPST